MHSASYFTSTTYHSRPADATRHQCVSGSMRCASACASHAPPMSQLWRDMRPATYNFTASHISWLKGFWWKTPSIINIYTSRATHLKFAKSIIQQTEVYRNISQVLTKESKKKQGRKSLKLLTKKNIRAAEATSDMQKLLQNIVPVLVGKRGRKHSIDNFVFRLHYRITTAALLAAAVLVSFTFTFDSLSHLFDHLTFDLSKTHFNLLIFSFFCRRAATITWTAAAALFSAWSAKDTAKLSHR